MTSSATTEPIDLDHPTPTQRRSLRFRVFRVLVITFATIGGAVVGFITTLAIVVAKAQSGAYIFAVEDLMAVRWEVAPVPIGAVTAFYLARRRPGAMAWVTVVGFGAMLLGIVLGALLGSIVLDPDVGPWAGGVIGAAFGLVVAGPMALRIRHVPRRPVVAVGAVTIVFLGATAFAAFGATNFLEVRPLDFGDVATAPFPDSSEVDAVVFLMGDGGAAVTGASPLLDVMRRDVERWSAALRRDSAVSVVYLGDVVYPEGVHDRSDPKFVDDSIRLWSQIDIVGGPAARRHGTVGLFMAGNHDWGNAVGDEGLGRVRNLQQQLLQARAAGTYTSLIPNAGDPGPIVRDLRRNVRIVFIDTHWFLQERSAAMHDQFFARLTNALGGAGDREVIIVAHHPYFSAGPHGAVVPGYHKGGLNYILKRTGAVVQDLNSPAYAGLLGRLRAVFDSAPRPPLVYAGGHDHSLQLLTGAAEYDPKFVLVSGAGSKVSAVSKGPALVWAAEQPGYMTLVFRKDDGVDLFVIGGDKQYLTCAGAAEAVASCRDAGTKAFKVLYSTSLLGPSGTPRELTPEIPDSLLLPDSLAPSTPWWSEPDTASAAAAATEPGPNAGTVVPIGHDTRVTLVGSDSVTRSSGADYPAGPLTRLMAGDLHRELWSIPLRLPVLDLDRTGGGLTPQRLIGGKQTVGLRFTAADGLEYEFRSVVKNALAVLPGSMRYRLFIDLLEDQMAAQFPFGGVVVGELLDAAGIHASKPVPVVMPDDARLGEFRARFAGRVGLLSVNAEERAGDRPGFAGFTHVIGDEEIDRALRADPASRFDTRTYVRTRLLDMMVGDWDRHPGQWRWGRRTDDGAAVWVAIPEDRDWAFTRIDGVIGMLSRLLLPRYVGFSARLPPVHRLAETGAPVDRRMLAAANRGDFVGEARRLQSLLTDSVLATAVRAVPAPFGSARRDWLFSALRSRRDQLVGYSRDYHDYVMRTLEIHTFDATADVVTFERRGGMQVDVTLRTGGARGPVRLARTIDPSVTRRVVVYLNGRADRVIGATNLPFEFATVDVDRRPAPVDSGETAPRTTARR